MEHSWKHVFAYEHCYKGPEIEKLQTLEEKDRHYLACHKKWIKNLKEVVEPELKSIALQTL